jgi:hypothetical protein
LLPQQSRQFPQGREHGPHFGVLMGIDAAQVGRDAADHDQRRIAELLAQLAQPVDVSPELKGLVVKVPSLFGQIRARSLKPRPTVR